MAKMSVKSPVTADRQESWCTPIDAAYNYPAQIETRGPWNIYADVCFNYWQPLKKIWNWDSLTKARF